jgi:hypothetical protein
VLPVAVGHWGPLIPSLKLLLILTVLLPLVFPFNLMYLVRILGQQKTHRSGFVVWLLLNLLLD